MEIIVPAAGLSSRFPQMKPKYLLYDYAHKNMVHRAIEPFLDEVFDGTILKKYNITIGILKEHADKHEAELFLKHEFGDRVNVVVLNQPTKGPADTVYQIIKKAKIKLDSEILVKDCDSFFDHEITEGNYVCVSNISEHEVLKKLASKSFVVSNENGIITNIVEKSVVSDTFCVGGYKFDSAKLFCDNYKQIEMEQEVFVSDVIQRCMYNGEIFTRKRVKKYIDVGTAEDWFEYNDKPVIFCDIDGTILVSQNKVGKNNYNDETQPLQENVDKLLECQKNGCQLIFTTARERNVEGRTRQQLEGLGFRFYTLIMNLQNSRRILINDFNPWTPYPRAEAINIERNTNELLRYL